MNLFPNPNGGDFSISYNLESEASVELFIVSLLGEKIKQLDLGKQNAGYHSQKINLSKLTLKPGVYILKLIQNSQSCNTKLIITN